MTERDRCKHGIERDTPLVRFLHGLCPCCLTHEATAEMLNCALCPPLTQPQRVREVLERLVEDGTL